MYTSRYSSRTKQKKKLHKGTKTQRYQVAKKKEEKTNTRVESSEAVVSLITAILIVFLAVAVVIVFLAVAVLIVFLAVLVAVVVIVGVVSCARWLRIV